ncbi:MAG: tetratricopeptide repeat protein [Sphingobacteriaceae bacterium]|nr:MAG: tetratricopeptide repeat protein [Sphingobacteriaceae bacterium]
MEILKKLLLINLSLFCAYSVQAQTDATLQKAFKNSYADEYKKNYTAAISDIFPFYAEGSYELNIRLGWLNYLNKNYTASQNYYLKAVNLRPNAIEARFGYIKPLSFLESWNKVLEQYTIILKTDPQNTQANYWAGIIYYNRKQFPAAAKCFEKVVALYPFDYDGNQMLGWSLLMDGKKAEARASFLRALLIKPDDQSVTDGLGRTK